MKRGLLIYIIIGVLIILGIFFTVKYLIPSGTNIIKDTQKESSSSIAPQFETLEQAKSRQIITLYDKVEIERLQDLESKKLCEIVVNKEEITSSDSVNAVITFDESLKGEEVNLWCDQFERFGISGDVPYLQTVGNDLKLKIDNCDYGRVTVPTVYFLFASSIDGELDYCAYPITVSPTREDEGVCHSEETIKKMKNECISKVGNEGYSIPDANGCNSVYCGWEGVQNSCPSEDLLKEAEKQCEIEGNTATRYSYDVSNQDFPCAQVRCSQCPNEENLNEEKNSCEEKGGEPRTELDFDTGCSYIYCTSPEALEINEEVTDEIPIPQA